MSITVTPNVRRLPESDTERMAAMERQVADLKRQLLALVHDCDALRAERDDLRNEVTALHVTEDNLRRGL